MGFTVTPNMPLGIPFYVAQKSDASCSLATATMLVNAAHALSSADGSFQPISQEEILGGADSFWSGRVVEKGEGVTLEEFAPILKGVLEGRGFKRASVTAVHVSENSEAVVQELRRVFSENVKESSQFIVLNFLQSALVGSEVMGHYSLFAEYDPEKDAVRIIDPDPSVGKTYWAPLTALAQGLATFDNDAKAYRGYLKISI